MTRDPLGFDPISHIQQAQNPARHQALEAYRQNILLRGTTIAGSIVSGPPIGEDGQPMTWERRQTLAAQRAKYDSAKIVSGEIDYRKDSPGIETEVLGTSSQAEVDKQPHMTIVTPTELVLVKLTPEQAAELK
jgi:hypothetical protein